MLRVAITGVTGYLGGHLAQYVLAQGGEVLGLTRRPAGVLAGRAGYSELLLDLSGQEIQTRLSSFCPSALIHTAALATPTRCEAAPAEAQASNNDLTARVLKLAPCKIVTLSTDLVFEGRCAPPAGFTEIDPPAPVSVYAHGKLTSEQLTLAASPQNSVVRVSLLFGKAVGERAGALGWMHAAVSAGKPLELFSDEFRSPSYVVDVVQNLCCLAQGNYPGVYHCASDTRVSRVEFGRTFLQAHGLTSAQIRELKRADRPASPPRAEDVTLCTDKLRAVPGASFHPLRAAMEEIAWGGGWWRESLTDNAPITQPTTPHSARCLRHQI